MNLKIKMASPKIIRAKKVPKIGNIFPKNTDKQKLSMSPIPKSIDADIRIFLNSVFLLKASFFDFSISFLKLSFSD